MTEAVTYESRNRIAIITINRPKQMNAIDNQVEIELAEAWLRFNASEDRVAVLTGAGDRAFSAGRDREAEGIPEYRKFAPSVDITVEKPVIAAVAGWCIGGALTLVQMCDLCVATEDAKFSYPEAKLGFAGGLVAGLAVRIPHKVAMELMLLGEPIDAQRAYQVGFVNRLVPPGQHLTEALKIAEQLANNAPLVLGMLKHFVSNTLPKGPVERAAEAARVTDGVFGSEDYREGKASMREKRTPKFTGR
ncbi:MAG TPA: enoyl-CoA hydratase-related protein [Xanthobacteraceae bacterium]|nr:enoyl-CoA hydratase-related protein [Xanthobacteraceae bacterium]